MDFGAAIRGKCVGAKTRDDDFQMVLDDVHIDGGGIQVAAIDRNIPTTATVSRIKFVEIDNVVARAGVYYICAPCLTKLVAPDNIVAAAAIYGVGTDTAVDLVITITSRQHVASSAAVKFVVSITPRQGIVAKTSYKYIVVRSAIQSEVWRK